MNPWLTVRRTWALSCLCFGVFFANMVGGKIRLLTQTGSSAPLDGVPEFLIFVAGIGLFVKGLMLAENKPQPSEKGEQHEKQT